MSAVALGRTAGRARAGADGGARGVALARMDRRGRDRARGARPVPVAPGRAGRRARADGLPRRRRDGARADGRRGGPPVARGRAHSWRSAPSRRRCSSPARAGRSSRRRSWGRWRPSLRGCSSGESSACARRSSPRAPGLLAWLVWLFLLAFPSVSGGSQGLIVPEKRLLGLDATPTVHFEVALALLALTALGIAAARRGAPGLELSALRQAPALATSLGVRLGRRRLGAFAASACLAGLAGGLSVQLAAVADPASYDPFLSFKLLVAVLLGGAASTLGPAAGVAALGLIALASDPLARAAAASARALRRRGRRAAARVRARAWRRRDRAVGGALARTTRLVPGACAGQESNRLLQGGTRPGGRRRAGAAGGGAEEGLRRAWSRSTGSRSSSSAAGRPRSSGRTAPGRRRPCALISGAVAPDDGRVLLDGRDLSAAETPERVIGSASRARSSRCRPSRS